MQWLGPVSHFCVAMVADLVVCSCWIMHKTDIAFINDEVTAILLSCWCTTSCLSSIMIFYLLTCCLLLALVYLLIACSTFRIIFLNNKRVFIGVDNQQMFLELIYEYVNKNAKLKELGLLCLYSYVRFWSEDQIELKNKVLYRIPWFTSEFI